MKQTILAILSLLFLTVTVFAVVGFVNAQNIPAFDVQLHSDKTEPIKLVANEELKCDVVVLVGGAADNVTNYRYSWSLIPDSDAWHLVVSAERASLFLLRDSIQSVRIVVDVFGQNDSLLASKWFNVETNSELNVGVGAVQKYFATLSDFLDGGTTTISLPVTITNRGTSQKSLQLQYFVNDNNGETVCAGRTISANATAETKSTKKLLAEIPIRNKIGNPVENYTFFVKVLYGEEELSFDSNVPVAYDTLRTQFGGFALIVAVAAISVVYLVVHETSRKKRPRETLAINRVPAVRSE